MATVAVNAAGEAAAPAVSALVRPESQTQIVFRRFRKHKMAVISLVLLAVIFIASLMAPVIAPFGRDDIDISKGARFAPFMSVQAETGKVHILGTDHIGRDLFTRMLYGARVTLTIAVLVAVFSTLIGLAIGSVAGYFRGKVDSVLMRVLEFMASIPDFPLLLILSAILITDPKIIPIPDVILRPFESLMLVRENEARNVVVLIAILTLFGWTGIARLARGMGLSLREREFVEASRALGASDSRIILRHIVPNSMAPIIIAFTAALASAFVAEVALSFLGFGVREPAPTWGNMMVVAQAHIFEQRLLPLVIGMPIFLCSLAFNFIGDGLRDALDPRMKM